MASTVWVRPEAVVGDSGGDVPVASVDFDGDDRMTGTVVGSVFDGDE